jgi:hypothetical protein
MTPNTFCHNIKASDAKAQICSHFLKGYLILNLTLVITWNGIALLRYQLLITIFGSRIKSQKILEKKFNFALRKGVELRRCNFGR